MNTMPWTVETSQPRRDVPEKAKTQVKTVDFLVQYACGGNACRKCVSERSDRKIQSVDESLAPMLLIWGFYVVL